MPNTTRWMLTFNTPQAVHGFVVVFYSEMDSRTLSKKTGKWVFVFLVFSMVHRLNDSGIFIGV